MSVVTESELRELWQNGRGRLPAFPAGTRFSAAAQDFLKAHRLEGALEAAPAPPAGAGRPAWDKPSVFPVALDGPVPVCAECGQPVRGKPEHLTQLDAGRFAPKTTPRLKLRGRVDSMHALVMLTAALARRYQLRELAGHLDTLAAYCREIMSAEYHARPVAPLTLLGKAEDELHAISHWPDRHLGLPHLTPGPDDHEVLHWLNVVRTQAREVEVAALEAFPATGWPDSAGLGASLAHALNRLSSAIYVLELLFNSGQLAWKASG
jgi:ethanolamine utilization cobalamin adenosyltransferase